MRRLNFAAGEKRRLNLFGQVPLQDVDELAKNLAGHARLGISAFRSGTNVGARNWMTLDCDFPPHCAGEGAAVLVPTVGMFGQERMPNIHDAMDSGHARGNPASPWWR